MVATIGHVELLDLSENWSLYTERLGQFFVANEIKDDAKQVAELIVITVKQTVRIAAQPVGTRCVSFEEVRRTGSCVGDHLDPKPLVIAERFKFHHRNQREGESGGAIHGCSSQAD